MNKYIGERNKGHGRLKGRARIIVALIILSTIVISLFTIIETSPPKAKWINSSDYLGAEPVLSILPLTEVAG